MEDIYFLQPMTQSNFEKVVRLINSRYQSLENYKGNHKIEWSVYQENSVFVLKSTEFTLVHFTEAYQLAQKTGKRIVQSAFRSADINFGNDLLKKRKARKSRKHVHLPGEMTDEACSLLNNMEYLTQELNYSFNAEGVERVRYVDPEHKGKRFSHEFKANISLDGTIDYSGLKSMTDKELAKTIEQRLNLFMNTFFADSFIKGFSTKVTLESKNIIEGEEES